MIPQAIFTALHALGYMTLFSVLVAQHLLIHSPLTPWQSATLTKLHWIFLGAWLLLLATGVVLGAVLFPIELYLKNGIFHLKFTLVLILLPLWFLVGREVKRAGTERERAGWAVWVLRVQLLVTALIPLLATLMARGYGSFAGQ